MHQQPNDRKCGTEAIGGNHFGPVMVYLSKVPDSTKADGSASWFKIYEYGYTASSKTWGTDLLNKNCGKQEVTIPANIAAGDYLLRAEAIALHAAGQAGGAQFYMTCYVSLPTTGEQSSVADRNQQQIKVTGSGSVNPAGVKFPGAYNANDPGIKVDIYGSGFNNYTIPGPAPYTG